jgi:hypothetical protein
MALPNNTALADSISDWQEGQAIQAGLRKNNFKNFISAKTRSQFQVYPSGNRGYRGFRAGGARPDTPIILRGMGI